MVSFLSSECIGRVAAGQQRDKTAGVAIFPTASTQEKEKDITAGDSTTGDPQHSVSHLSQQSPSHLSQQQPLSTLSQPTFNDSEITAAARAIEGSWEI